MDIVKKNHTRLSVQNPMPEKVQRQFRSWCLRRRRVPHEKTEALREEWERLDPATGSSDG